MSSRSTIQTSILFFICSGMCSLLGPRERCFGSSGGGGEKWPGSGPGPPRPRSGESYLSSQKVFTAKSTFISISNKNSCFICQGTERGVEWRSYPDVGGGRRRVWEDWPCISIIHRSRVFFGRRMNRNIGRYCATRSTFLRTCLVLSI